MSDPMAELRAAIERVVRDDPEFQVADDCMLGDFVIVSSWPSLSGDNGEYTVTPHDRNAPAHAICGLLHIGLNVGVEHEH